MQGCTCQYSMQAPLTAQPAPVKFKCTVVDNQHPKGISLEKWCRPAQEPLDQTSHDAQRKPLTVEQIYAMCSDFHSWSEWDGGNFQKSWLDLCRAIEAAHGIKETTK
jgi:hypothetical protein